MNLINFQEEFKKIARKKGMGEAMASSLVCHRSREILGEIFPNGDWSVESFRNGLLTINFKSSGALARFGMLKPEFQKSLDSVFDKNPITDIKAVIA